MTIREYLEKNGYKSIEAWAIDSDYQREDLGWDDIVWTNADGFPVDLEQCLLDAMEASNTEVSADEPTSFLVEFTPEQMRTFWDVTNGYEEACLGWWEEDWSDNPDEYPEARARLRSVQSAVENARPLWD